MGDIVTLGAPCALSSLPGLHSLCKTWNPACAHSPSTGNNKINKDKVVFFLGKLTIRLNLDSKHSSPRNCPSTTVSSLGCSLPKSNHLQCAVHHPSVSGHVSPLLPTADLAQAPMASLLPRGTVRMTFVIMILRSSSPNPIPV